MNFIQGYQVKEFKRTKCLGAISGIPSPSREISPITLYTSFSICEVITSLGLPEL